MMVVIFFVFVCVYDVFVMLELFFVFLGEWIVKVVIGNFVYDVVCVLFMYYFMFIVCNVFIMFVFLCFSCRVVGVKCFDVMKLYEWMIWYTNLCMFWFVFVVMVYVLLVIVIFLGKSDLFVSDVSVLMLKVCGLLIGYMTWDLGVILVRWDD